MSILGVVAEYDPFHNGHARHLALARAQVQPRETIVALSPCFKQRGAPALFSPTDRARWALEAGADAVFALPVLWTVRDAEHYALGAVSLLASLGATHLAFGAETDDLPLLRKTAELLESPPASFTAALRRALDAGSGYPAALSSAVSCVMGGAAGLLDRPNNTLAVCYLRAVLRLGLSLEPVLIHRDGAYHAEAVRPEQPSASALRAALLRGSYAAALEAVPPHIAAAVRRRFLDAAVPDESVLDALLVSRLRSMTPADYAALPDLSEGVENALRAAAVSARSRKELLAALSGKRYPASRVSRLCAYAMLGVTRASLEGLSLPDHALLLGLRKNPEMTARWRSLSFPVVSSFTEWKKAAHPADLAAWSLWARFCRLPDTLPFTEKTVVL